MQEQVAQFVWRGVAWRGVAWRGVAWRYMALALGFISILGGGLPAAFLACACIISMWRFSVAYSGSSSGQRLLCILCVRLRMSSWFCLAQRSGCWRSCAF